MEANQITGSKDNSLSASTGSAVGRMETPINLFIQWWQLGTVLSFVPGIYISLVYILFPAGSLLSADVWLRGSPEKGTWFTDTHWKANWPWHDDGSCAVPSTARAANLPSLPWGAWSGFASCSAVSCTLRAESHSFSPCCPKQLVGSALHLCTSCGQGCTKRRGWLRWEPAKDPVSQGSPVNLCSKTPPGSCPSCSRAEQLNTQLLWLAREHNSEGGDGGKEFFCCVTQISCVPCTEQGLSCSVLVLTAWLWWLGKRN